MQLTPRAGGIAATIALVAVSVATPARADDVEVHGKVSVYQDDDATTVISPRTRVAAPVGEHYRVAAGWAADVTTSASVDVTTAATRRWRETRNEVYGSAGTTRGPVSADLGAVFSTENDWDSLGLGARGSLDLLQRNVTLSGRYGLSLETVGRNGDERVARPLTVHSAEVGLTQVLSPEAIGSIGYTVSAASGALESPYRFVPVAGGRSFVPESHPNTRLRHAVTLRVRQHLFRDSALRADYRLYTDDWGVLSHTLAARYLIHFDAGWTLRFRVRGYLQDAASFYRDDYEELTNFVTADRELSRILGLLGGVKVALRVTDVGPFGALSVDAKADVFRYTYPEYAELAGRTGLVMEAGLSLGL